MPSAVPRARMLAALVAAVLAALALSATAASDAEAYDAYPCGPVTKRPINSWQYQEVQYCPLAQGSVPVYQSTSFHDHAAAVRAGAVVGHLWSGGCANWFVGQQPGYGFWSGGYVNHWWAYTMADNGRWGYVPQVYFRGGVNWEADAGLKSYYTSWRPAAFCGQRR